MKRIPLPEVLPTGIEVWMIEFKFDAPCTGSDWALLNAEEQAHALRYHQFQDQVRFIKTRSSLRRLLAMRLMSSPKTLHIQADNLGKPRLQAYSNIEFNVSHSGHYALIALSTIGAIGIDIEYMHRDVANLEKLVFTSMEQAMGYWSSSNFIELWVVKESVLKALGFGITNLLQSITVLPNFDGSYHVILDQPSMTKIRAWSIDVVPGYTAALALANSDGWYA